MIFAANSHQLIRWVKQTSIYLNTLMLASTVVCGIGQRMSPMSKMCNNNCSFWLCAKIMANYLKMCKKCGFWRILKWFWHISTYPHIRYCYGKIIGHSRTYCRKIIRVCDFLWLIHLFLVWSFIGLFLHIFDVYLI